MTVALEQDLSGAGWTGGTTVVIADAGISSFVANNLVILTCAGSDARYALGPVTDDGTGSWVELGATAVAGGNSKWPHLLMYYKIAAGDETAITITSTKHLKYSIKEFSGLATASPVDAVSAALRTTANVSATETATEAGLAFMGLANGLYADATSTFSGLDSSYLPDGSAINGVDYGAAGSWKTTTVGSTSPSGTITDGDVAYCLALFKGAGGGGPAPIMASALRGA